MGTAEGKLNCCMPKREDLELILEKNLDSEFYGLRRDHLTHKLVHRFVRSAQRPIDMGDYSYEHFEGFPISKNSQDWRQTKSGKAVGRQAGANYSLELEFVNGYKTSSRNNIYHIDENEILFPAGALAVIMNVKTKAQRFLGGGDIAEAVGHSDEILSITLSHDRTRIATAEISNNPLICVWDRIAASLICKFHLGERMKAVKNMSLSPDASLLFLVAEDDDHKAYLFNAQSGFSYGSYSTGAFSPFDTDSGFSSDNEIYFVLSSPIDIFIFYFRNGEFEQPLKGWAPKAGHRVNMSCVKCLPENECKFITGSVNGELYLWQGTELVKKLKPFDLPILSMHILEDKLYAASAVEGHVKIFETKTLQEDITSVQNFFDEVKAISVCPISKKIVVGLKKGQIIMRAPATKNESKLDQRLIATHESGELWSFDMDRKKGLVVTVGEDNKIIVYDPSKKEVVKERAITSYSFQDPIKNRRFNFHPEKAQSRCIAIKKTSEREANVAIGKMDGMLEVMKSAQELDVVIFENKLADRPILLLEYSPNSAFLAVGAGEFILVLEAEKYSTIHKYSSKPSSDDSFYVNLDWDEGSEHIQGITDDNKICVFNLNSGSQDFTGDTAGQIKWETGSGRLNPNIVCLYPENAESNFIMTAVLSKELNTLVTGDLWGLVSLWNNGECRTGQKSYRAHSSNVMKVKLASNKEKLFTVGGEDRCLMQWRIVKN